MSLLVWAAAATLAAALGPRALHHRSFWFVRAGFFASAIALLASFGAFARAPLNGGWAALLLLPPCWAQLVPRRLEMFVLLVLVPPACRAAYSTDVAGVVVAFVAGLTAALLYGLFSVRAASLRAHERAALACARFGAAGPEEAGALLVAMRVHDGLSGGVALARARAIGGAPLDGAQVLAIRGRATLASLETTPTSCPRVLGAELRRFAAILGAQAEVVFVGEAGEGPLWADARDIVVEILANHARHGSKSELRLTLDARSHEIAITASGGGPAPSSAEGRGRGLRNVGLRVAARGGSAYLARTESGWTLRVALPARPPSLHARLWWLEALAHAAPPLVAWVIEREPAFPLLLGATSVLLLLFQIANSRGAGRAGDAAEDQVARAVERAAEPQSSRAHSALLPVVDAAERALAARDSDEARAAIASSVEVVEALLAELELGHAGLIGSVAERDAPPPQPGS